MLFQQTSKGLNSLSDANVTTKNNYQPETIGHFLKQKNPTKNHN